jgi:hypothetical protein
MKQMTHRALPALLAYLILKEAGKAFVNEIRVKTGNCSYFSEVREWST